MFHNAFGWILLSSIQVNREMKKNVENVQYTFKEDVLLHSGVHDVLLFLRVW